MSTGTVILDQGSSRIKCGYSSNTFPIVLPSTVAKSKKRDYYGNEALFHKKCEHPIQNGLVTNWETMEKLWDHLFRDQLNANTESSRVLITEPPFNSINNRNTMMETMFEKYHFSACNISIQSICILYAQGLVSGMILDSGEGYTHTVPIFEGYIMKHLMKRLEFAGKDISTQLFSLLNQRGCQLQPTDMPHVVKMKEDLCFVSADLVADDKLTRETCAHTTKYTLPDGRMITLGRERYLAPELLFDPLCVNSDSRGVAEMVFHTIQEADLNCRSELYKHVVLAGGSTAFPGFKTRLERELHGKYIKEILKNDVERFQRSRVCVEDPPSRTKTVFLGACVLADMMHEQSDFWVTQREYEECGLQHCMNKIIKT